PATTAPDNTQTTPASDPTTDSGDTGNGALSAHKGDCLINQGTNDKPKMVKVACRPGAYQVLKRIDGTSDVSKCDGTPGYQYNYYYKNTIDRLSFVLCMKQL